MRPRNPPALSPAGLEQPSEKSRRAGTSQPRDDVADLTVITDIDDERLWI